MSQTLSRAKAALLIQTLDVIGVTLCTKIPDQELSESIMDSCISLLHGIRQEVAATYNLNIHAKDSIMGDVSKYLTPAEEAELICEELELDDLTDE